MTISDFVADLRAATPSNAAELAVPDQAELRARLAALQKQLAAALRRRAQLARSRLDGLRSRPALQEPLRLVQDRRQGLDRLTDRLAAAEAAALSAQRTRLTRLAAGLDAMSPLKVLARGYAVVSDESGALVQEAAALKTGQIIQITFRDDSVSAQITEA